MSRLTIDEVINHCRKTCESIEVVAVAQGKNQDDITSKQYWEHYLVEEWLNELKKYKDAEEQGMLIKLPCKVGDNAYVLFEEIKQIKEYKVSGYKFYDDEDGICMMLNQCLEISVDYLGKDLFLTKEEAEKKLKEMRSDK